MSQEKRLLLATGVSMIILISWNWFYEQPRLQKAKLAQENSQLTLPKNKAQNQSIPASDNSSNSQQNESLGLNNPKILSKSSENIGAKSREEAIFESKGQRVKIANKLLSGSLSLRGARFDDLQLTNYFVDEAKKDPVVLLAPSNSKEHYFVDFGWAGEEADLPNPDTLWQVIGGDMSENNPLVLSYKNKGGIEFLLKISVDEAYAFKVEQIVKNHSNQEIKITPYGRVERAMQEMQKSNYILLEGIIGVFDKVLQEQSYESLVKLKSKDYSDSGNQGSWLGITDKYWLTALIPDKSTKFSANVSRETRSGLNLYQVSFVGEEISVAAKGELVKTHHFFAGAKKVDLLDEYSKKFDLTLFDRAIDFGWFYFLTRPFFSVINFLSKVCGNFGLAILAMTVLVKLALFPMANKSYLAIARLKILQPKTEEIRARFKDDKMQMNREIMELYKREKVNPAAGCLPLLIQIPVFFALYKVLFVTLDMRHATFYGWIHDLSAPDPTSLINLFGLLPFTAKPPFMIGIWPILMGLTMIWQQKLNPPPSDPTQATVMKLMPFVLTFVLAAFPAGLVIYWTWSNLLSIAQQIYITKRHVSSGAAAVIKSESVKKISNKPRGNKKT